MTDNKRFVGCGIAYIYELGATQQTAERQRGKTCKAVRAGKT